MPPHPIAYSPHHSQVNPDTPPPPPPKPTSHEPSRQSTPHTGQQPFTSPPAPATPPKEALDARAGNRGEALTSDKPGPPPDEAFSAYNLPQPPELDDGWIPDVLKDKTTTDLQPLLSNPSLLSALASTHPSHEASQQHLQTLLSANINLANHVQGLESHLSSLHAATEALLLHHSSLELSWRKKQSEMDAALAPWSPKALYQRLSAAIAEQEAICEAVEESFLEAGGISGIGGAGEGESGRDGGQATERETVEWIRRVRNEGAKLEARREARTRWDEGRVGGWR